MLLKDKRILAVLTVALAVSASLAENPSYMKVELTDGKSHYHHIDDIDRVEFDIVSRIGILYTDSQNRGYGIEVSGPSDTGIYTLEIPATAPERVVWTLPLGESLPDCNYKLSFAYCSSVPIGEAKVVLFNENRQYYSHPDTPIASSTDRPGTVWPGTPFIWFNGTGTPADRWKVCSLDLSEAIATTGWDLYGKTCEFLRIDFDFPEGAVSENFTLKIKDLRLEPAELIGSTKAEDDGEDCAMRLQLDISNVCQLSATQDGDVYTIVTDGGIDPWLFTKELKHKLSENAFLLSFDYRTSQTVSGLQAYFCPPLSGDRFWQLGDLEASPDEWKSYSTAIDKAIEKFSWGNAGDCLRLDFGSGMAASIDIRNLRIRGLNKAEKDAIRAEEEHRTALVNLDNSLKTYLNRSFNAEISLVEVGADKVNVTGTAPSGGSYALAEVTPYEDALLLKSFRKCKNGIHGAFNVSLPRVVEYDGVKYDRLLSKWVVVSTDGGTEKMVSACRYVDADHIDQSNAKNCQDVPANIKKGGEADPGRVYDAIEMGMRATLVGIPVTAVMWSSAQKAAAVGDAVIQHNYLGKPYYFSKGYFENLDKHLLELQNAGISVFTVFTIRPETFRDPNAYKNYDHELGMLMQHPDYSGQGNFAMVNLTQPGSVNFYAAALDFLASRYSDGSHGRIHRYVMHNEIDDPNNWNDAGWKPQTVYMDQFVKSTRMAHNIIRQYNTFAQILVPVTQQWTFKTIRPEHDMLFAVKDLFGLMNDFSRVEGDYYWGMGYHSYPYKFQSRTWEDHLATWSMDTELVTFRNLEVLDKWAKTPANMYKQQKRRDIWLTENGSGTPTYSEKELTEQAACAAYALKKIKALDGIQTLIWHANADNAVEGSLNLGLHYRHDDPDRPWGRKPAWYVFQAFGTEHESEVLDQYLPVIGVSQWSEIMHQVNE